MAGDFNPAVAVPVWPFVEWLLFFFTGVSIEAARGLAIACFFANLVLSYLLCGCGERLARWMALLGVTLLVTSPFLYCFSRLAILEPLQTTSHAGGAEPGGAVAGDAAAGAGCGVGRLLFALMTLTKTTALFLVPAVVWAIVAAAVGEARIGDRCALVAIV